MSDDDYSSSGGDFGDSGSSGGESSLGFGGNDSYTETSTRSWGGRLMDAIKGVLVGLIFIVASLCLLWWNEGRALRTAQGLVELKRTVVTVPVDAVKAENEGKPVHLSGETAVSEVLKDPDFPVSAMAVRLRRAVEMYQWKETEHTETHRDSGGSERRVKTWSYRTQWVDRVIDSSHFRKPDGHRNPTSMRFPGRDLMAKVVQVGAFRLPPSLVEQADNFEPVVLEAGRLNEIPGEIRRSLKVDGPKLYVAGGANEPPPDPSHPRVGDLRIHFEVVRPGPVSVIARQAGNSFAEWRSRNGTTVERLEPGRKTAAEMVAQLVAENNLLTWLARFGGFVFMAAGLAMLLRPLVVVADVLPILGSILQFGVFLASVMIAASLSVVTIAVAWLAYRPVLAGALIAGVLALLVLVRKLAPAKKKAVLPPLPPLPRVP